MIDSSSLNIYFLSNATPIGYSDASTIILPRITYIATIKIATMNIIVTGASKGIGFETTKAIAAAGDHTIVVIARDLDSLNKLKSACIHENVKARVLPLAFDLSDPEAVETDLIRQIIALIPSVDVLINNAGSLINKPFADTQLTDIQQIFRTNYVAPSLLIKGLIPFFNRGAHVVSISSMGGVQGSVKFPGLSCYSSSKAAIATLTECLAEEYKEHGFRFNSLALGSVNTEMLQNAFPGYSAPVEPAEMGRFIADFALNSGRLFNGKILSVSSTTP